MVGVHGVNVIVPVVVVVRFDYVWILAVVALEVCFKIVIHKFVQ
jgi:hypothetical protein